MIGSLVDTSVAASWEVELPGPRQISQVPDYQNLEKQNTLVSLSNWFLKQFFNIMIVRKWLGSPSKFIEFVLHEVPRELNS